MDLRLRAEHEPINPAVMCLGRSLVLSEPFRILISFDSVLLFHRSEWIFVIVAARGSPAAVKQVKAKRDGDAR